MSETPPEPPIDDAPLTELDELNVLEKKWKHGDIENEPSTGAVNIEIIPRTEERFMCISFASDNPNEVAAYNYAVQRVMRRKTYYPYHTGGIEDEDKAKTGPHVWEINPGFHTPQITVPMVQNWLPLIHRYAREYLDLLRRSS